MPFARQKFNSFFFAEAENKMILKSPHVSSILFLFFAIQPVPTKVICKRHAFLDEIDHYVQTDHVHLQVDFARLFKEVKRVNQGSQTVRELLTTMKENLMAESYEYLNTTNAEHVDMFAYKEFSKTDYFFITEAYRDAKVKCSQAKNGSLATPLHMPDTTAGRLAMAKVLEYFGVKFNPVQKYFGTHGLVDPINDMRLVLAYPTQKPVATLADKRTKAIGEDAVWDVAKMGFVPAPDATKHEYMCQRPKKPRLESDLKLQGFSLSMENLKSTLEIFSIWARKLTIFAGDLSLLHKTGTSTAAVLTLPVSRDLGKITMQQKDLLDKVRLADPHSSDIDAVELLQTSMQKYLDHNQFIEPNTLLKQLSYIERRDFGRVISKTEGQVAKQLLITKTRNNVYRFDYFDSTQPHRVTTYKVTPKPTLDGILYTEKYMTVSGTEIFTSSEIQSKGLCFAESTFGKVCTPAADQGQRNVKCAKILADKVMDNPAKACPRRNKLVSAVVIAAGCISPVMHTIVAYGKKTRITFDCLSGTRYVRDILAGTYEFPPSCSVSVDKTLIFTSRSNPTLQFDSASIFRIGRAAVHLLPTLVSQAGSGLGFELDLKYILLITSAVVIVVLLSCTCCCLCCGARAMWKCFTDACKFCFRVAPSHVEIELRPKKQGRAMSNIRTSISIEDDDEEEGIEMQTMGARAKNRRFAPSAPKVSFSRAKASHDFEYDEEKSTLYNKQRPMLRYFDKETTTIPSNPDQPVNVQMFAGPDTNSPYANVQVHTPGRSMDPITRARGAGTQALNMLNM